MKNYSVPFLLQILSVCRIFIQLKTDNIPTNNIQINTGRQFFISDTSGVVEITDATPSDKISVKILGSLKLSQLKIELQCNICQVIQLKERNLLSQTGLTIKIMQGMEIASYAQVIVTTDKVERYFAGEIGVITIPVSGTVKIQAKNAVNTFISALITIDTTQTNSVTISLGPRVISTITIRNDGGELLPISYVRISDNTGNSLLPETQVLNGSLVLFTAFPASQAISIVVRDGQDLGPPLQQSATVNVGGSFDAEIVFQRYVDVKVQLCDYCAMQIRLLHSNVVIAEAFGPLITFQSSQAIQINIGDQLLVTAFSRDFRYRNVSQALNIEETSSVIQISLERQTTFTLSLRASVCPVQVKCVTETQTVLNEYSEQCSFDKSFREYATPMRMLSNVTCFFSKPGYGKAAVSFTVENEKTSVSADLISNVNVSQISTIAGGGGLVVGCAVAAFFIVRKLKQKQKNKLVLSKSRK